MALQKNQKQISFSNMTNKSVILAGNEWRDIYCRVTVPCGSNKDQNLL